MKISDPQRVEGLNCTFVSDSLNSSIRLIKELIEWLTLRGSGLSIWSDDVKDVVGDALVRGLSLPPFVAILVP